MKKICLILIIGLAFFSVFHFAFATNTTMKPVDPEGFKYNLIVPLPTSNGTVKQVTSLVDYIKTLYYFALGIAGLTAMVMIIIAGFQWLTSAGNYSKAGQAKSRMSNAVFGLLILLGAYLLLNTINPSLTRLKEPLLYFIDWTEDFNQENTPGGGPGPSEPDWCHNPDGTDKITTCDGYSGANWSGGHLSECMQNPCNVPGACYPLAPDCATCQAGMTCSITDNLGHMSLGYEDQVSCESNPCGVSGGCVWHFSFCASH